MPGINYTKVHVGCKNHTDAQQADLQAAVSATIAHSGTPFMDSIIASRKYFEEDKNEYVDADSAETGDAYVSVSCQPMFLIDVTDGFGYYGSSVATIEAEIDNLYDAGISAVAVGFGIDDATQINAFAARANVRGSASNTDDLYALHDEVSGDGVPFLANNKEELVDALSTITENIKASVFHGSAPAPTTSADLGDTVIVANFDASDWSGELQSVTKDDDTASATYGEFVVVEWTATDRMPAGRDVFTVDPSDHATVIVYQDSLLNDDNWLCKDLGDIINSTPIVVGRPSFYYPFDGYETWKLGIVNGSVTRDTMIYVGANDGSLHAFRLEDSSAGANDAGREMWAFVPEFLHDKLDMADDPTYDMCDGDEYCHQYFVDGSPVAGDIHVGSNNWKTIVVTGLREGGEAYFALDVTSSQPFLNGAGDQAEFLWQFTDTELGQTWAEVSIDRVTDGGGSAWGVFFGSGYSENDQDNKSAYLFGIQANDKADLWDDGSGGTTNRILITQDLYTLNYDEETTDFAVGDTVTGGTSTAHGTVVHINTVTDTTGSLIMSSVAGDFVDDEELTVSGTAKAKANGTASHGLADDALASPMVADLDADFLSDRLYVGNLYGTLFRVADIGKGEEPSITGLFTFNPFQTSANVNPIRAKCDFAYRSDDGEIWVYFGTGRYETQSDKTDLNRQYFFGLKDDLTSTDTYTYVKTGDAGLQLNGTPQANLEAKFLTDVNTGREIRYIDGENPSNLSWAIKLNNSTAGLIGSERIIEKPLVVGGVVFFSTFTPDQDVCAGNGDTWVFAIDYETGKAPTSPVFDLDEDGDVDEDDQAEDAGGNKYIPAGISVGSGQGSHPVLHKSTLFVTTTGEGLEGLKVDLPGINVQLRSWQEKF